MLLSACHRWRRQDQECGTNEPPRRGVRLLLGATRLVVLVLLGRWAGAEEGGLTGTGARLLFPRMLLPPARVSARMGGGVLLFVLFKICVAFFTT